MENWTCEGWMDMTDNANTECDIEIRICWKYEERRLIHSALPQIRLPVSHWKPRGNHCAFHLSSLSSLCLE